MRRRLSFAVAALVVAVPSVGALALHGCSSDPAFESLCLWVADPNNCYRNFREDTVNAKLTCEPGGAPTQVDLSKPTNEERNGTPNGSFLKRDALDVCFLTAGGTITIDPPIDVAAYPRDPLADPITYKMTYVTADGTECGSYSYTSPHGFSFTVNPPANAGAATSGDAGTTGADAGRPIISSGSYTQVIQPGSDAFDVTCPNGEAHHFNLYEVEGVSSTADGGGEKSCPMFEPVVPHAAFVVNPGGIKLPGAVSFAITWPPTDGTYPSSALIQTGKPVTPDEVVYFNCAFDGAPKTCANQVKDGAETDVDCGGRELEPNCPQRCGDGQLCVDDCDCAAPLGCVVAAGLKVCGAKADSTAGTAACSDKLACINGVKDGTETAIDCGGSCPTKCADGQACVANSDCANGFCDANKCAAASCTDGVLNGSESAIDCGGTCPGCVNGKACTSNGDCTSHGCVASICQPPTCDDKVMDGAEVDVDCGGTSGCPACADGMLCNQDSDCTGAICGPASVVYGQTPVNRCFPATCQGDAGHVCGQSGACELCANGQPCSTNADCLTKTCVAAACAAEDCTNNVLDGFETAVDCGGPNSNCARCPAGSTCKLGSDCASGTCASGFCG